MLELDKRLTMTAGLVAPGFPLADIGTDHAYLPCFLVLNGITPRAIASDVADGPLLNAENTVQKYDLTDKIECRKSDGLLNFSPGECNEIVIAGMGGNLISDILAAAEWIKRDDIHLILQPMTHSEDVRYFLLKNGFVIDREVAVIDGRKTYIALSARYRGQPQEPDGVFTYFGLHLQNDDEAAKSFVKKQKHRLEQKLHGYEISGKLTSPEAVQLCRILEDQRAKEIEA